jgi:hypothetical protein
MLWVDNMNDDCLAYKHLISLQDTTVFFFGNPVSLEQGLAASQAFIITITQSATC